ncbi:hypothetical protein AZ78_4124 [Lysobacter capsici AZ78]|uniref:Uncharacterized protein n=1 Tax=Lysobacter capsici AZ78 TaxID=1444315 RepID=A0A108UCA1_9GAMM|nr:hypothetical protein AZ78_4124 [Lysobacter capsici AZ78]
MGGGVDAQPARAEARTAASSGKRNCAKLAVIRGALCGRDDARTLSSGRQRACNGARRQQGV